MASQNQPQPPIAPQASPVKKRFPKWLKVVGIVIAALVAVTIIAALIATTATKAPQKVSDQFVDDIQAGNTSAAYTLTSEAFKQATTETQLSSLVEQISPSLQGEEKVTGRAIKKSTGTQETAVLVYTIKTPKGNTYLRTTLQKNNGVWQIVNFRSDDQPLDTTVE